MRVIEAWLAETGWGSHDTLMSTNEDEGGGNDKGSEDGRSDGNSEDEVSEDNASSNSTMGSDRASSPDIDPDVEYASSENDEDTMDGEYGFSSL